MCVCVFQNRSGPILVAQVVLRTARSAFFGQAWLPPLWQAGLVDRFRPCPLKGSTRELDAGCCLKGTIHWL